MIYNKKCLNKENISLNFQDLTHKTQWHVAQQSSSQEMDLMNQVQILDKVICILLSHKFPWGKCSKLVILVLVYTVACVYSWWSEAVDDVKFPGKRNLDV